MPLVRLSWSVRRCFSDFPRTWSRGVPLPLVRFALLATLLTLCACAKKQAPVSDTLAEDTWNPPVYVDTDDGLPLSAVELAALNSTGELDKGLDQAAMADVAVQQLGVIFPVLSPEIIESVLEGEASVRILLIENQTVCDVNQLP